MLLILNLCIHEEIRKVYILFGKEKWVLSEAVLTEKKMRYFIQLVSFRFFFFYIKEGLLTKENLELN